MEFAVDRNVFQEAVQKTLGIVDRKTTIPILNNILIQTRNNTMRIVATDREIGLIADYKAQVETPGEITIAARKLYEMIREMEGETVFFKTMDNYWAHITCAKVVYRIPGISSEEFPEVPEEDVPLIKIPCPVFREMVGKTFFAISTDDMRPSLNGVYLEKKNNRLEMVATDGHRLAMAGTKLEEEGLTDLNVEGIIIPRKGVSEIRKLVEGGDEFVELGTRDHICVVKKDDVFLRISLIDGEYPDYQRVVPKDQGVEILLERDKILHSLRRMGVMSSEMFSGVKILVSEGKMVLNSINPDVGEANDEIDINYTGEEFAVGYNVRYLIDAIDVINDDMISFEMRIHEGPGVIKAAGNENYMCIVMPIKLGKE